MSNPKVGGFVPPAMDRKLSWGKDLTRPKEHVITPAEDGLPARPSSPRVHRSNGGTSSSHSQVLPAVARVHDHDAEEKDDSASAKDAGGNTTPKKNLRREDIEQEFERKIAEKKVVKHPKKLAADMEALVGIDAEEKKMRKKKEKEDKMLRKKEEKERRKREKKKMKEEKKNKPPTATTGLAEALRNSGNHKRPGGDDVNKDKEERPASPKKGKTVSMREKRAKDGNDSIDHGPVHNEEAETQEEVGSKGKKGKKAGTAGSARLPVMMARSSPVSLEKKHHILAGDSAPLGYSSPPALRVQHYKDELALPLHLLPSHQKETHGEKESPRGRSQAARTLGMDLDFEFTSPRSPSRELTPEEKEKRKVQLANTLLTDNNFFNKYTVKGDSPSHKATPASVIVEKRPLDSPKGDNPVSSRERSVTSPRPTGPHEAGLSSPGRKDRANSSSPRVESEQTSDLGKGGSAEKHAEQKSSPRDTAAPSASRETNDAESEGSGEYPLSPRGEGDSPSLIKRPCRRAPLPPYDVEKQKYEYKNLTKLLTKKDLFIGEALCHALPQALRDRISPKVIRFFVHHNLGLELIILLLREQIDATDDAGTLLRSNDMVCNLMSFHAKFACRTFLRIHLGPLIEGIIADVKAGTCYEINPTALNNDLGDLTIEDSAEKIILAAEKILNSLDCILPLFPRAIRIVCYELKSTVSKKFPESVHTAIGGYLFLRLLCPAIISPEAFDIIDGVIPKDARRALMLVSKTLQQLGNGILFENKEDYMKLVNPFISENLEPLRAFFDDISLNPDDNQEDMDEPLVLSDSELFETTALLHLLLHTNLDKVEEYLNKKQHFFEAMDYHPVIELKECLSRLSFIATVKAGDDQPLAEIKGVDVLEEALKAAEKADVKSETPVQTEPKPTSAEGQAVRQPDYSADKSPETEKEPVKETKAFIMNQFQNVEDMVSFVHKKDMQERLERAKEQATQTLPELDEKAKQIIEERKELKRFKKKFPNRGNKNITLSKVVHKRTVQVTKDMTLEDIAAQVERAVREATGRPEDPSPVAPVPPVQLPAVGSEEAASPGQPAAGQGKHRRKLSFGAKKSPANLNLNGKKPGKTSKSATIGPMPSSPRREKDKEEREREEKEREEREKKEREEKEKEKEKEREEKEREKREKLEQKRRKKEQDVVVKVVNPLLSHMHAPTHI